MRWWGLREHDAQPHFQQRRKKMKSKKMVLVRSLFILTAISSLLVTIPSPSWAATNLNSSKSNVYRVTYDTTVVSPAQAAALLADLEKLGPADEAKLKKWLPANFKRLGIQADHIKKIVVLPASNTRKSISIIFLKNPADEAAAIAVGDDGGPQGPKDTKSGVLSPR